MWTASQTRGTPASSQACPCPAQPAPGARAGWPTNPSLSPQCQDSQGALESLRLALAARLLPTLLSAALTLAGALEKASRKVSPEVQGRP